VERVPGWRDSRLGPPDADRPYFELMGDVLQLWRIKDIGAAAPLVALVVELGAHGGGHSRPLVSRWYETQTDPMMYTSDQNPMIYIRVPDSSGGGGVDWHYFSSGAVNAVQNTKAFPKPAGITEGQLDDGSTFFLGKTLAEVKVRGWKNGYGDVKVAEAFEMDVDL
jgi:hypothetical protein